MDGCEPEFGQDYCDSDLNCFSKVWNKGFSSSYSCIFLFEFIVKKKSVERTLICKIFIGASDNCVGI
jgi:hypothetical protein